MTEIRVLNHGPLKIKGDFAVKDSEGGVYGLSGRDAISICRCGYSNNKPFCDGAHNSAGFNHVSEAFDLPEPKG